MTKEQYEKLVQYEQELRYAYKLSFMSMSRSKFNEIMEVYNEIWEPLSPRQANCGTCRLKAMKKIGEAYFQFQQEMAEEAKEERMAGDKEEKQDEIKPVIQPVPEKRKAGRPKKIDLNKEA